MLLGEVSRLLVWWSLGEMEGEWCGIEVWYLVLKVF